LNAILFIVPEKTRRNPRSGFMVQDPTLFRIGLGQSPFAQHGADQTNQAGAEEAQGPRFRNREDVDVGVAAGESRASTEETCASVNGDLRGCPDSSAGIHQRAQLADLDRLYETVAKTKGQIDIVFANAGVGEFVPFGAVTEEHFDKLFNINVRGTLFTVQKALPLLKDGGSIILNGSVASVKGSAAFGVYAASKAAIRSFVRTWTTDLKDRGIRSNVVSPGPINTPLASRQPPDVIARIVSTIPMGHMGKPVEVAKVALFLASDDSSFVTGIELFVDGGRAQV